MKQTNRALHWDGVAGQAWHGGSIHQLRMAPRVCGEPVRMISYYPLSRVSGGRRIFAAGEAAERDMTAAEQAEVDLRLELMSRAGLSVLE